MSLEFALPHEQRNPANTCRTPDRYLRANANVYHEIDPALIAREVGEALSAHECGHAVCALANGVEVIKIQNGVRRQFTMYNMATFPSTRVREIVTVAGPVAESDILKQMGLGADSVCSMGDAAHLLGHREFGADASEQYKQMAGYNSDAQIARLYASLNGHLMYGKELPSEHQHLLGLIEEARTTLTNHRDVHASLIAALFGNGGVLRKSHIQRIWQARQQGVA